jgi:hypothetical protein
MRRWIVAVLATGLLAGVGRAQAVDFTPRVSGATVDIQGGRLTAAVQAAGVGTAIRVERFSVSIPWEPSGKLILAPVTTVLDLAIRETSLSIARISLDLKPLQQAGVALPGGFIGALIRAQLEAFDTRDIALAIRASKLTFEAKSGLVKTKLEGALAWGEGTQLGLRVDAIRINFGLPIPRPLIMKRLAWLDPLEFIDVRDNTILVDVAALAKVVSQSLPKTFHFKLPEI